MDQIKSKEELTRYIFSKSHYRSSDKTVKPNAFMPANDGKTSVFLISDISENKIWDLGDREVAQIRQKALKGRADILALNVFQKKLEVDFNNDPPRHANIIGWPEEKSKQISIAQELAADAHLHLKQ